MIVADREEIRVSETDDEILAFDVSDDVLERTATIIGGQTLSSFQPLCRTPGAQRELRRPG